MIIHLVDLFSSLPFHPLSLNLLLLTKEHVKGKREKKRKDKKSYYITDNHSYVLCFLSSPILSTVLQVFISVCV